MSTPLNRVIHRLLRLAVNLSTLTQDDTYSDVDSGDLIQVTDAQIKSVSAKLMQAVKQEDLKKALMLREQLIKRVYHSKKMIFQLSSRSDEDELPYSLGDAKLALKQGFNLARKMGDRNAMSLFKDSYNKLRSLK